MYESVENQEAVKAGIRKAELLSERLDLDEGFGLISGLLSTRLAEELTQYDNPEWAQALLADLMADVTAKLQERGHMVEVKSTWDSI